MSDNNNFPSLGHEIERGNDALQPSNGFHNTYEADELQIFQANPSTAQMIKAYYQSEQQANKVSLERAWSRIAAKKSELGATNHTIQPTAAKLLQFYPEIPQTYPAGRQRTTKSTRTPIIRTIALLVAILFIVLSVASFSWLFNLSHHTTISTSKPTIQAVATKTSLKQGQTVYGTPKIQQMYENIAWSTDGKRIAVADDQQVAIWDATTGLHQIKLETTDTGINQLAWSPKTEQLAIMTAEKIIIVDGQSGNTITTYTAATAMSSSSATNVPTAFMTSKAPTRQTSYQNPRRPQADGAGFRGVTWSPDGTEIASANSAYGANSTIQIWNPQTGALLSQLASIESQRVESIAWSPDGKYIVANQQTWQDTQSVINVWNTKTQQVVFQQSAAHNFDNLSWQPGTQNIAFSATINDSTVQFQIWNVMTQKIVKIIPDIYDSMYTWSPDGQKIVYGSQGTKMVPITIVNVANDQQVYTYQIPAISGSMAEIEGLAWSSNSKYIATEITSRYDSFKAPTTPNTYTIKVWVA